MRISESVPDVCGMTTTDWIAWPLPMAFSRSLTVPFFTGAVTTRVALPLRREPPFWPAGEPAAATSTAPAGVLPSPMLASTLRASGE
ncbi:hypothetical protein D3C86_1509820 [compost metagenome]